MLQALTLLSGPLLKIMSHHVAYFLKFDPKQGVITCDAKQFFFRQLPQRNTKCYAYASEGQCYSFQLYAIVEWFPQ